MKEILVYNKDGYRDSFDASIFGSVGYRVEDHYLRILDADKITIAFYPPGEWVRVFIIKDVETDERLSI